MPLLRLCSVIVFISVLLLPVGCATGKERKPDYGGNGPQTQQQPAATYSRKEVTSAVSDFFGVTSEAAGSTVERIFRDLGNPVGYIYGEEGSAAFGVGFRYGKGILQLANGEQAKVYWQGPSIGWDWGANGSKVFTLVYNMQNVQQMYQRFPGVEGSAYLVAGIGVNYQRGNSITLAPMRTGVGARLGANVGYLAYSRKRQYIPL